MQFATAVGQSRAGQDLAGQGRQSRAAQKENLLVAEQGQAEQNCIRQGRARITRQGRADNIGQGSAGPGRAGQGRAGQGRAGQGGHRMEAGQGREHRTGQR